MYEENKPESVYDALIAEAPKAEIEVSPTPSAWATLHSENVALQAEVTRLTNLSSFNYGQLADLQSMVRTLEEYLDSNWDSLEMHAEEIADIFNIEVEKTVEVSITVDYTVTVTVPRNKIDEIDEDSFNYDISDSAYWLSIDRSDATVREIEIQ